ncbi:hypothetical protein [Bythopirellula goksoeyrii]|uniref:hypothetical protein n=1 Tax=Bythopirellula goksoeyrii TaxID=1400387 RepID=UPI0011CE2879|nr:hypothetical protein [Bythopirellula goksoeyrii]
MLSKAGGLQSPGVTFVPYCKTEFVLRVPAHSELRWRDVVESFAEFASQLVGPLRTLRISVTVGSRVEPVECKASCNCVL